MKKTLLLLIASSSISLMGMDQHKQITPTNHSSLSTPSPKSKDCCQLVIAAIWNALSCCAPIHVDTDSDDGRSADTCCR